MKDKPYMRGICTIVLLAINGVIFLGFNFISPEYGQRFMLTYGALIDSVVIQSGQYYRFLSSMFVHFDINHLANNMLMLGVLGYNLEYEKGHIKFLLIYFISGIGGNVLSFGYRQLIGRMVMSGGASGAVFGLMGGFLGSYLKYRRPIGKMAGRGMLVMVGFSVYFGMVSAGVDNAAHIGGLITGFIISLLL